MGMTMMILLLLLLLTTTTTIIIIIIIIIYSCENSPINLRQPFLTLEVRHVVFEVPYLRGATHAKIFVTLLRS